MKFRKQWAASNEDFKKLWEKISQKTRYNISLNAEKLIAEAVEKIDAEIKPRRLAVRVDRVSVDFDTEGKIKTIYEGSATGERLERERRVGDVVARIAHETGLTRHTVLSMLERAENLDLLFENPEEYTRSVSAVVSGVLNELQINEGLEYVPTGDVWDLGLFEDFISYKDKTFESTRSLYDHVAYDSDGERDFAKSLEDSSRVTLFTKLPATFVVETPLGTYNPDWAIVLKTEEGEKLYLVRETKFVGDLKNLRPSEMQKILCGEKHFQALGVDFKVVKEKDLSDLG